jgi:hypothetical protein
MFKKHLLATGLGVLFAISGGAFDVLRTILCTHSAVSGNDRMGFLMPVYAGISAFNCPEFLYAGAWRD